MINNFTQIYYIEIRPKNQRSSQYKTKERKGPTLWQFIGPEAVPL